MEETTIRTGFLKDMLMIKKSSLEKIIDYSQKLGEKTDNPLFKSENDGYVLGCKYGLQHIKDLIYLVESFEEDAERERENRKKYGVQA